MKNQLSKSTHQKKLLAQTVVCILMFITGMALAYSSKAQKNVEYSSNFYAITGKNLIDTSWLFGTYHVIKSSYLDELPAVQHAFNIAEEVVVETIIDSSKFQNISSMGLLKDKTLLDLIESPFKDSLENELQSILGVSISQLNQLKPMNVMITLSLIYLFNENNLLLQKYSGTMLDQYFAEDGKNKGKTITSLETIESQMDLLFNKFTNEEQVEQLKIFLRNKEDMKNQGNELLKSWFRHDLNKMYSISQESLPVFGNEDYLLNNRNRNWLNLIPSLMQNKSQFIAIGALHLAGPNGLINQLKLLGYSVTPIKL